MLFGMHADLGNVRFVSGCSGLKEKRDAWLALRPQMQLLREKSGTERG